MNGKIYLVCGARFRKVNHGIQNYFRRKTLAGAIAIFKRLPVATRQIDVRGDGKPRCILYGKWVRQFEMKRASK